MDELLPKIRAKLQEPSTRVGLMFLAGLTGHQIPVEVAQNIIDGVLLLTACYEVWRKEHPHKDKEPPHETDV